MTIMLRREVQSSILGCLLRYYRFSKTKYVDHHARMTVRDSQIMVGKAIL